MQCICRSSPEMRTEAAGQARRANGAEKQRIAAELDGACKAYLGSSSVVAMR